MKPETAFRKNRVIPFLKTLRNTYFEPIQQISISGSPDFMLCVNGHFVALELKASDQKPRPLQEKRLSDVVRAGGLALVADPNNWELIKKQLSDLDTTKEIDNGSENSLRASGRV